MTIPTLLILGPGRVGRSLCAASHAAGFAHLSGAAALDTLAPLRARGCPLGVTATTLAVELGLEPELADRVMAELR